VSRTCRGWSLPTSATTLHVMWLIKRLPWICLIWGLAGKGYSHITLASLEVIIHRLQMHDDVTMYF
jgi:hypothetical protein